MLHFMIDNTYSDEFISVLQRKQKSEGSIFFRKLFSFGLEVRSYIKISFYPTKRWCNDRVVFSSWTRFYLIYDTNRIGSNDSANTVNRVCRIHENSAILDFFYIQ